MCGMHIDWKPFRVQCESNKPINECEAPPTTFIMKTSRSVVV